MAQVDASADALVNGTPGLLASTEYMTRFQAAQSAMHKSLLVVIGLAAFWLAMEHHYARFNELQLKQIKIDNLRKESSQSSIRLKQLQYTPPAAVETFDSPSARTDSQREHLAGLEKKIGDLEEDVAELKKEAIGFSLAGTTMQTRNVIAPSLWFMVLGSWLLYFAARREDALRNAAAFRLSLDQRGAPFGGIGNGTLWLAPLPVTVSLHTGSEHTRPVNRSEIAWCLGWNLPSTDVHYRRLLLFLFFGLILIELRILYIATEITGWLSMRYGWVGLFGHYLGVLLPAILFAATSLQIGTWLMRPSSLAASMDNEPNPARRQFVIGGLGAFGILAYTVWRDSFYLDFRPRDLFAGKSMGTVVARTLRTPRYVPAVQRGRNRVLVQVPHKSTFLERSRKDWTDKPERAILHYADNEGRVRLFSAAAAIKRLTVVSDSQAADGAWLSEQNVKSTRTWQWEAAALDRIEAGKVQDACKLLLAGIKLDASANILPKNRRLVHLLAGLSTRYVAEAGYLHEIKNLFHSQKGGDNWLSRDLKKWRDPNSNWHERWTAKAPVWWHHPTQTRMFEWQRTRKMKRPPLNPEIRQRPVKIA